MISGEWEDRFDAYRYATQHPMCRCTIELVQTLVELLTQHGVCGLTDPYFTIEASSDAEAAEKLIELSRT